MGFIIPTGLRVDIACGTGFVVETGFFCAYTCLFWAALPVLISARRLKDERSANSAWVFLIFSILMYLVATTHLVFAGFQFYRGTLLDINPKGAISYLQDPTRWEHLGLPILAFVQTWLGDALMIYRCYIVWDNNLWLVAVPIFLLFATIGVNLSLVDWLRNASPVAPAIVMGLFRSFYPLALLQNFMTTGLIILRIFLRHRASKKAGIRDVGSGLSLIHIVRIMIESAAIYTIQILVLTIVFFLNDNFRFVVRPVIVPTIGITFVLLALRIEASRHTSTTSKDLGIRSSMMPQWLREPDREVEIGSEDSQHDASLPTGDSAVVTEQKLSVHGDSGTDNINWGPEFSSNSGQRRTHTHTETSCIDRNAQC